MANQSNKERVYSEYLFGEMKLYYPWLAVDAEKYVVCGPMQLLVTMKNGKRYIYDNHDRTFEYVREMTEGIWKYRFGRRLCRKMEFAGLGREALSERTGISRGMISNYLNGKALPNAYNLEKLAQALGCTIDDLLNFPR